VLAVIPQPYVVHPAQITCIIAFRGLAVIGFEDGSFAVQDLSNDQNVYPRQDPPQLLPPVSHIVFADTPIYTSQTEQRFLVWVCRGCRPVLRTNGRMGARVDAAEVTVTVMTATYLLKESTWRLNQHQENICFGLPELSMRVFLAQSSTDTANTPVGDASAGAGDNGEVRELMPSTSSQLFLGITANDVDTAAHSKMWIIQYAGSHNQPPIEQQRLALALPRPSATGNIGASPAKQFNIQAGVLCLDGQDNDAVNSSALSGSLGLRRRECTLYLQCGTGVHTHRYESAQQAFLRVFAQHASSALSTALTTIRLRSGNEAYLRGVDIVCKFAMHVGLLGGPGHSNSNEQPFNAVCNMAARWGLSACLTSFLGYTRTLFLIYFLLIYFLSVSLSLSLSLSLYLSFS
jgi:hypothetical protein